MQFAVQALVALFRADKLRGADIIRAEHLPGAQLDTYAAAFAQFDPDPDLLRLRTIHSFTCSGWGRLGLDCFSSVPICI